MIEVSNAALRASVLAICLCYGSVLAAPVADAMVCDSVSLGVEDPRRNPVQTGVRGFTLYDLSAGILFEPSSIWDSGEESDPAEGMEPAEFRRVVSSLVSALSEFPATPTYSARSASAPHDPSLGFEQSEWAKLPRPPMGSLTASFGWVEGDYNRSLEVVIPIRRVEEGLGIIGSAVAGEPGLAELLSRLRQFWEANRSAYE